MPKLTKKLSVVSILVLVAGLIVGTALVRRVQEIRRGAAPAAPYVAIFPVTQDVSAGDTFSFTVNSDTGTHSVAGVDLVLTYNPSVLEVTGIVKGTGLSNLSEWINEIDDVNGKISYTAVTGDLTLLVQGSNVELIQVTGNVRPGASDGVYNILFDTDTILGDAGANDIGADISSMGSVSVSGAPQSGLPVVEDFESYQGSNSNLLSKYNYNGNTATISLNPNFKGDGSYSVQLDYTVGDPDNAGAWSHLAMNKTDWSSYNAIDFWFKGDGSKRDAIIQFSESDKDHWEYYVTTWGSAPSSRTVRFSKFVKPVWNTQGDGVMDLTDIEGLAFYMKSGPNNLTPGSGTVYFDAFKLKYIPGPTPTPTPFIPTNTPTLAPTFTPTPSPVPSVPPISADTTLYLEAYPPVYLNKQIEVDLMIDSGLNSVVGTEVYLTYDTGYLQALDVVPGPFFPNVVETIENIDGVNGRITTVLHIPPQDTPIQGVGTLAKLIFTTLQEGTTVVDITGESIIGAINTNYQNALKSARGVTLNIIRPSIIGDINDMGTYCGDGTVNILDYTILFEHFGEAPSTHPCADINNDGEVNILDYVLLYENFGLSV